MATTNFAVTLNTFANTTPGFYKYKEVKRDINVANGVLRYLANNGKSRCNDIADALNCCTQAISAMMRKSSSPHSALAPESQNLRSIRQEQRASRQVCSARSPFGRSRRRNCSLQPRMQRQSSLSR